MCKYRDIIPSKVSNIFIINVLKLSLENNYFSFEDDICLQTSGTAMGTKVAPTYASLLMGFLEDKLFSNIIRVNDFSLTAVQIEKSWLRYLDHCWIIWNENYGNQDTFHYHLNNLHSSIKVTKESNPIQLFIS